MEIAAEAPEVALTDTAEPLCSKCKLKPRADADSTNPWCTDCKTKYQKEYTAMKARIGSEQAFSRGVTALRNFLIGEFERLGSGAFTGYEIAALVQQAPAPKIEWKG